MSTIFLLLIIYQIKHFLADYPMQGRYMLGKFLPWPKFILPLSAHALVHSLFTYVIALYFAPKLAIPLAFMDGAIHFVVDRIKASPDMLGRFHAITKKDYYEHMQKIADMTTRMNQLSATQEGLVAAADVHAQINEAQVDWRDTMRSNTFFWWSLGADQMAHHLTHYLLIYLMVR